MSVAETFDHGERRPDFKTPALKTTDTPKGPPANQNTDAVSLKTWIAVVGAALGPFLAVLTMQIVNSSLADIQGAIGTNLQACHGRIFPTD